ncbi:MAG: hypothetical protein WBC44_22485, partial [Planctomycetaceae bacterium]
ERRGGMRMGNFENPGAVLIVAAILLDALAGVGLIIAALSMAAAWGWRPAMARRDGRWPAGLKMLVAGVALLALALLSVSLIVAYYYVVVVG